jgi:hypothetical protein
MVRIGRASGLVTRPTILIRSPPGVPSGPRCAVHAPQR